MSSERDGSILLFPKFIYFKIALFEPRGRDGVREPWDIVHPGKALIPEHVGRGTLAVIGGAVVFYLCLS
jgi:hypothetical protein